MIIFLGFVFQLIISLIMCFYGFLLCTNAGFSNPSTGQKILGVVILIAGSYGIYDLSTMFSFNG